jgi:hypothetical protein
MPRYSNYGSLDNVMVDEGDVAFNRVNARLRPDQLKEGDVAYSSNGRMDLGGAWQPRKGITNFDTAITLNTAALRLPFYLYANTTASSISRRGRHYHRLCHRASLCNGYPCPCFGYYGLTP